MTETTQDTETFTVTLETSCPEVTAQVTLVSKTDLTIVVDVQMSPGSGASWKNYFPLIDWGDDIQDNPVSNGHNTHTYATAGTYTIGVYGANSCGKNNNSTMNVDIAAPTPVAHGTIEELTYPASVKHGADMRASFKIHNTGGETGTFIARLYKGVLHVGADWRAVIHAGDRPSGAITVKAPTTGDHVYYTIGLFLET